MPKSLRSKIKHLCYKGELNERERDRILDALDVEPCEDCISREELINELKLGYFNKDLQEGKNDPCVIDAMIDWAIRTIKSQPSVTPKARWIPVSERLPKDLQTVNVTWVNHEPEPYYHDIKDKSFVATAIFSKRTGHWYWYSTTCADYLGEYGENEIDKVDDAIEIVAWQPLPTPYKAESEE